MPTQISLHDVTKSYGDRLLLDGVSLSVRPGERVGIVGENGAGKSTLLRILAGAERPDEGHVVLRADGGIGYLGQTPDLPPDHTVQDAIDAALADLREMERRLRSLESGLGRATPGALEEYGELLTVFELRGGYEADARVEKALHALGLARLAHDRQLGGLSGRRAGPAGAGLSDRRGPRGHASRRAHQPPRRRSTRLAGRCRCSPTGARSSPSRTTGSSSSGSRPRSSRWTPTAGAWSVTAAVTAPSSPTKAAARRRWEQDHARWCERIAQLTDFAAGGARSVAQGRAMKDGNKMAYDRDKGRVQSSVSSRVRNAQERLQRLRENPVARPPEPLRFRAAPGIGEAEGTLVRLEGVRVGDRLAVDSLTVSAGDRLLIHGANGAGKSTLLRVLAGVVPPDRGTVQRRGRIGFLAQEIPVSRPAEPLFAAFRRGLAGDTEELAALLLSFGLFREGDLPVPVGALSAGQRRRLALARLLARPADLLLLDEPTNHLALTLVEELETALSAWPGALVVVSHDRLLRRRFGGRPYEIRDGRPAEAVGGQRRGRGAGTTP